MDASPRHLPADESQAVADLLQRIAELERWRASVEAGAERKRTAMAKAQAARLRGVADRRTVIASIARQYRWADPHRRLSAASIIQRIVEQLADSDGNGPRPTAVRNAILAMLGPAPKI